MNAVRRRPDAGRCGLADRKKTANGCMRRGRPEPFFVRQVPTIGRCRAAARTNSRVGRPAVRFDHSPFEYDGRLSRITNNEPRLFLGLRCGVPPRQTQTDNDASGSPQRVAGRLARTSPTISHTGDGNERSSQAACDLRPAFFNSMNDERPTMNVKSAVFMRQRFLITICY